MKPSVGIIGAGISGLYTALLLREQGYEVTIFECQSRIGGRIYTYRFPSTSMSTHGYFEAGAMRIPCSSFHESFFKFVRYLNQRVKPSERINLIPYILEHGNNRCFINNEKGGPADGQWAEKLNLARQWKGQSAVDLLKSVVSPWVELLHDDFDAGFEKLLEYDEMSFRHYLRREIGWPHEVVEYVELMNSQTNQYDLSVTELIMQNMDFGTKEWVTIEEGMSRLPEAAASVLGRERIHLNAPISKIVNLADGRVALSGPRTAERVFDAVVCAIPPAAIAKIQERPRWSFLKEQAIRGIHHEPLYKIGLRFKTRFWEQTDEYPCLGGQCTTDLRFRWLVFPSNGMGTDGEGVLLLYSWMTDASRFNSMSRDERLATCLHDLKRFYADVDVDLDALFIDAFDIMWHAESSTGDAMFLPGQFSRYFDVSRKPEGNVYFSGETFSRHHTWISGALESSKYSAELLTRQPLAELGDGDGVALAPSGKLEGAFQKMRLGSIDSGIGLDDDVARLPLQL